MDRWGQCAMWQCSNRFKQFLSTIWFGRWSNVRGRCCGQQRMGARQRFREIRINQRRWIYLFNEEQDGDFNYLGYIIQTVEHWIDQCHFNFRRFVRHQVVHSIECWRQPRIGFGNWNFVLRRTSRRSLHRPGFKRSPVHLGNAYRHLQWNPARRELPSHLLISASYGGKFEWRMTMYNNIQIHIRLKW